jgi:hypothetical protein
LRSVILNKSESRIIAPQSANINNNNGHKNKEMRNESIHARTDVDVLLRTTFIDLPRRPQILVIVIPARTACGFGAVIENWEEVQQANTECTGSAHPAINGEIAKESRQRNEIFNKTTRIKPQKID